MINASSGTDRAVNINLHSIGGSFLILGIISIHTLRMEGDTSKAAYEHPTTRISIHPPFWRAAFAKGPA